ncbi:MAG: T9SS type A sorting domain-containing protein [Bacteroidetes bacterium]|nr:T9SS type A sorting domain-containing protein [Bacteroidota bacterium]
MNTNKQTKTSAIKTLIALIIFGCFTTGSVKAQCNSVTYANSLYSSGCGIDYISNVTFAGINNNTGCNPNQLYSSFIPNLTIGQTYALSVTTGGDVEGVRAWIDYDGNGTFTNTVPELVMGPLYNGTNPATYIVNVTIPISATPGLTRLRVRCNYGSAPSDPVAQQTWGETEDYCVNIIAAVSCTAAPNAASISALTPTICTGQTVNFTATGVSTFGGVTYQWQQSSTQGGPYTNVTGGSSGTTFSPYQTGAVATGTVYYVLVSTCTSVPASATSNEIAVVGKPIPAIPSATVLPATVCVGQPVAFTATTSTSGAGFSWSGPNGFSSILQNPTIPVTQAAHSGIYNVISTLNGCNSAAFPLPLSVINLTAEIVSTKTIACLGTSDTLHINTNTGTSFQWNNSVITQSNIVTVVNTAMPTVFTATVTDLNSCSVTAGFTMSAVDATMSVLGAWDCNNGQGGSGILTAQSFTPSTIAWYGSPTSTTAISSGTSATGISTIAINNSFADSTLYVQAMSGGGGGRDSLLTTLVGGNGASGNVFDILTFQDVILDGFNLNLDNAVYTIQVWYRTGSAIGFNNNVAGWTQLGGNFNVTGAGMGNMTYVPMNLNFPLQANQTYGFAVGCTSCGGTFWYSNGTGLGNLLAQNADIRVNEGYGGAFWAFGNITRNFNGYVRYKKAGGGCASPKSPVTLTVSPQPTIELSSVPVINTNASPVVVCSNETYTVTASGAFSYTWTNSINTMVNDHYVVNPANGFPNYYVEAESLDGCTNSTSFSLFIKPAPVVTAASFTNSICQGDNITLFALGDALTYTWSANANSSHAPVVVLTPNQSGLYTVAGTATNGCSSSSDLQVTVHIPDAISVSSSKPNGICAGETVNLTATGALTYTWTSSNAMFNGAAVVASPNITTNYFVESADANGCHNSAILQQKVDACVGVNELKNGSLNLNVYPNPNNGTFTVELNNGTEKTLELLDLTGRVVFANTTKQDVINIDIQELAHGIYYLKVKSNNTVETVKIVKQ